MYAVLILSEPCAFEWTILSEATIQIVPLIASIALPNRRAAGLRSCAIFSAQIEGSRYSRQRGSFLCAPLGCYRRCALRTPAPRVFGDIKGLVRHMQQFLCSHTRFEAFGDVTDTQADRHLAAIIAPLHAI